MTSNTELNIQDGKYHTKTEEALEFFQPKNLNNYFDKLPSTIKKNEDSHFSKENTLPNNDNTKDGIYQNNSPVKALQFKVIPHYTFPDPQHFKYNLRLSHRNMIKPIDVEDNMEIGLDDSLEEPKHDEEINKSTQSNNNNNQLSVKNSIPKIQTLPLKKESLVQKLILDAEPDSTIHLPATIIRFTNLVLNKPITIKGLPGTIIEVLEGPIIIEPQASSNKEVKVTFCECTIHADYYKTKILDNIQTRSDSSTRRGGNLGTKDNSEDSFKTMEKKIVNQSLVEKFEASSFPSTCEESNLTLFEIRSGAVLEVRDCHLKSFVKLNLSSDEGRYIGDIHETAFVLRNNNKSIEAPSLILKSTSMANFYTFISSDEGSTVCVYKSFLTESRGHSLNFTGPACVKIAESVFDRPEKSAINIRYSKESLSLSSSVISIKNNEIMKGNSYGISIFGETTRHQNIRITIEGNKLLLLKKDGIGIKFINFAEININSNTIHGAKGNGIYLHNVQDLQESSQIQCKKNSIHSCENNGIIIKNAPSIIENNDIALNQKNGIFLMSEDDNFNEKSLANMRIILNFCRIHENQESGINISGKLLSPIILNSCSIRTNRHGVYINEKPSSEIPRVIIKDKKKGSSAVFKNEKGTHFCLEKCEIANNSISGIHIKSIYSPIYISQNVVNMNKEYALYLDQPQCKELVIIKDLARGNLLDYFNGYIGGPWGELTDEKPTSCKSSNPCNIF